MSAASASGRAARPGAGRPIGLALRVAHLRGVGPDQARFDPLTLDFTTGGQAADRALLHLVNTGGKTTLIRLLSSLVVPAARDQVGKANIGEYIDTGDTAHVVCAWDTDAGTIVTGVVAEWPGRVRPANAAMGDLQRRWYVYRADGLDAVDVTDLPFDAVDDTGRRRRRTAADFAARMDELFRTRPQALFTWARSQADWAARLEELTPLDPELFRYQMRMNDEETGAKALVAQFSTADAVVRFFITALNDQDTLRGFADTLAVYAQAASRRGEHTLELEFCTQMQAALELHAHEHDAWMQATAAARMADVRGGEFAGALDSRLADDADRISTTRALQRAATEERAEVETVINRLDEQRQQLALEAARLMLASAEDDLGQAQDRVQDADRVVTAWRAVPVIDALARAESRLAAANAEFARAEGALSPLRTAAEGAAAQYAAKLRDLAREAEQVRQAALADRDQADADREAAERSRGEAERRDAALQAQAATHQGVIDTAAQAVAALRTAGILDPAEDPAAARDRHVRDALDAQVESHSAADRLAGLEAQLAQARATADAAAAAATHAATTARSARDTCERYVREAAALGADEQVATLAGTATGPDVVDSPAMAATLAAAAAADGTAADTLARTSHAELDRIEPEIAALQSTDTASPAGEVSAVCQVLTAAGIGAVPAVRWLVANVADADARAAMIDARPQLAAAVVVSDAARLPDARRVLAGHDGGKVAIWVCPPAAVVRAGDAGDDPGSRDGARDGFVLAPHRALLDPAGAQALLVELLERQARLRERVQSASDRAQVLRAVAARLDGFATAWANTSGEQLHAQADAADAEETAAALEAQQARTDADRLATAGQELAGQQAQAQARADAAHVRASRCEQAAAQVQAAANATSALTQVAAQRRTAQEQVTAARAAVQQATVARDAAVERASAADMQRRDYAARAEQVPVAPADTTPDETIGVLHARWTELASRLASEEAGSTHTAQRDQAVAAHAHAAREAARLSDDVAQAARDLAGQLGSADPDTLAESTRLAEVDRDAAHRTALAAEAARDAARALVAERSPAGRAVHVQLPDDWDVSTLAAVQVLADRVQVDVTERQRRRAELEGLLGRLDAELRAADTSRTQLVAARGMWPDEQAPAGMPAYAGAPGDAGARMRELLQAREAARVTLETAAARAAEAWALVRDTAVSEDWISLTSAIRERCRVSPADEVAVHAASWARDLGVRVLSLRHDLEELDTHRDQLVLRLVDLCDTQRRLLLDVTRQSVLPDGLGGLSGQPAFKIGFDPRPVDEARGLLAERVDTWARELAASSDARVRADDRIRWLTEALADTVRDRPQAGRFKVEVLKPNIDGQVQYRTPDRIGTEYSGGQELTLAVMLYCTLAAVRAAHRTSGARPPGVLILDNPFGAASNPALIAMQQALAARSGVQLICATGLDDPAVKHSFDGDGGVVISLRNDRDQRRGVKYLRIADEALAAQVTAAISGGRDGDDPAGYIDAVRYHVDGTDADDH